MAGRKCNFSGWATRANMRCSDGRIIAQNAFKDDDGKKVPIVWNHNHSTPDSVLGYGILHNEDEGVRVDCYFNDTENGRNAKALVEHGDINALSIFANRLKEQANVVIHGVIREVSLVFAGANPGAFIDSVVVHSDGSTTEDREQGILYTGTYIELHHADDEDESDQKKAEDDDDGNGETIRDVINTLSEKQKNAVAYVIDSIVNGDNDKTSDKDDEEDDEDSEIKHNLDEEWEEFLMKTNLFDRETMDQSQDAVLSHAEGMEIVSMAKDFGGGSLKAAMEAYVADNRQEFAHTDLGFDNISTLFPEYKDVKPGVPETLTTDQGWITKVLAKVHKSPISRIRTRQIDARDISKRRAQPYKKGEQKKDAGNLSLLSRTTDPITVYIRSKLDRDDIIDITDFDVVQYMYSQDRQNLNEELARQIMIGDGRSGDQAIDPTKIRPIWSDDDLYVIHRDVDLKGMKESLNGTNTPSNFGENYIYAEAVIESLLYAREKYRGSGSPDFYCTPHLVNVMLLARDLNGRRIYDNVNELKAALNVNEIITAEQFEEQERTTDQSKKKKLLGIMVNLADYSLGATKGGQITHFTDFDINFNQEVSLLETRCSGALTRVMSAIVLEEDVTENP